MTINDKTLNELRTLCTIAYSHELHEAGNFIKDFLDKQLPREIKWKYRCKSCGLLADDPFDVDVCETCGSNQLVKYAPHTTYFIPNFNEIKQVVITFTIYVCSDPMWPESAQIRIINQMLRYARFSSRLEKFEWNSIENAQALGFKNMEFRIRKDHEPSIEDVVNYLLYIGITTPGNVDAVERILSTLNNLRTYAEWVQRLHMVETTEDEKLDIIEQHLLTDFQVDLLAFHLVPLKIIVQGKFPNRLAPVVHRFFYDVWNQSLGEEYFRS